MKISIDSTGSFDNTMSWLTGLVKKDYTTMLRALGELGVTALALNTPIRTGILAKSWEYSIRFNKGEAELSFINTAYPNASVNVAKIVDLGHYTGTGGYVSPRNYIKPAMDPVFKTADKLIEEELK